MRNGRQQTVASAWRSSSAVRFASLGRRVAILLVDGSLAAISLLLAAYLRNGIGQSFDGSVRDGLYTAVPLFVIVALVSLRLVGLHRNAWEYASVADLLAVIEGVTLAIVLFLPAMFLINRLEALPRAVPIIQWFILIMLLGGVRFVARLVAGGARKRRPTGARRDAEPVLLVGSGRSADLFLRALQRDPDGRYDAVGILEPDGRHLGLSLRGVPILGTVEALEQTVTRLEAARRRPKRLVLTEDARNYGATTVQELVIRGESLGLEVARLPAPVELRRAQIDQIDLQPIELVDLLNRPQVALDRAALGRLIEGRRVMVTGAGGSIGGELTRQIAALAPARLILLEAGEFNLYQIDLTLHEMYPQIPRAAVLCNIRERARVMQVFEEHRPELVFHAAALKHVPMVELNPREGLLTNVIGTRNIADATRQYGARAMVQVSSDKVVNPTSVMGATKRLAELYCHALDLAAGGGADDGPRPRFITVRFGNVLGSSGSLVPLFLRQLSRGGPLTVTDPEIRRYFMTVREAVGLVLHASAFGLERRHGRGRIFVLDMGEPIRIIDIARRMIRLAGYEPDVDIDIKIVGLRPGEKLFEELFDRTEQRLPATLPGVLEAAPIGSTVLDALNRAFDELVAASASGDAARVRAHLLQVLASHGQPGREAADRPRRTAAPAAPVHGTAIGSSGMVLSYRAEPAGERPPAGPKRARR